jgi:hypothetical protein
VDRRFANSLYVKMQILLHFAKVVFDFTHRNQQYFLPSRKN